MTVYEVLAIGRLRQWAKERTALRNGKTTNYRHTGWVQRQARMADARLVRVMDFERALGGLDADDQLLLVFTYRDHVSQDHIAAITGWSPRTICYKLPLARQRLAERLDRLGLL